jgi:uncharacterized hydrophobic protein (TIGR00271 family)
MPLPPGEVDALRERMASDARMDRSYVALLVVAAVMASLGLEQNSAATIIGAMVVAPVMLPIRALAFGFLRFERPLMVRSLTTLGASVVIVVALGLILGKLSNRADFGSEILSRTSVTFLGLGVALAGGVLSALSRAWKDAKITDSLIGVGISVALVPPLCTVGITLAYGAPHQSLGAGLIFLTNLVGIALACMVVFWMSGYGARERWRTYAGLAIFAALLLFIAPILGETGRKARELNNVKAFVTAHATEYLPAVVSVESADMTWTTMPSEIVVTVRSTAPPSRAQVRALNDAIDRNAGVSYRLTVVEDPATTVSP